MRCRFTYSVPSSVRSPKKRHNLTSCSEGKEPALVEPAALVHEEQMHQLRVG